MMGMTAELRWDEGWNVLWTRMAHQGLEIHGHECSLPCGHTPVSPGSAGTPGLCVTPQVGNACRDTWTGSGCPGKGSSGSWLPLGTGTRVRLQPWGAGSAPSPPQPRLGQECATAPPPVPRCGSSWEPFLQPLDKFHLC